MARQEARDEALVADTSGNDGGQRRSIIADAAKGPAVSSLRARPTIRIFAPRRVADAP